LRQEGEEEQRHLWIERIGECSLPEHLPQQRQITAKRLASVDGII
jgi:hypothetical protein